MSKATGFRRARDVREGRRGSSFAGAANNHGVSVATVSRAVTRLEERLGGRRSTVPPTTCTHGLWPHAAERAARIYAEAEEAEDFARETSSRPRGLVKLAAPLSFGARWVAPLLPEFLPDLPGYFR